MVGASVTMDSAQATDTVFSMTPGVKLTRSAAFSMNLVAQQSGGFYFSIKKYCQSSNL